MLKIRLQRIGKRGQAYFRVVVTEHTVKPQGKYLELLGSYDPHKNKMTVDREKVKYWISQGARLSETANNLLVSKGIIDGDKVQVWKPKKKKGGETTAQELKPIETKSEAPVEVKEKTKEEPRPEEVTPTAIDTPVI